MAVKLVALDIDGTLILPGESEPGTRLGKAVHALRESGVLVVLASGRMFPGTSAVARHLGLDGPVICQQGCSLHAPDGRVVQEFAIARGTALELVAYAREAGHPYEWFNPLRYVVSQRTESSEEYARVSGVLAEYHAAPEHSGVVPTGVGIISSAGRAQEIHKDLVARYQETLHVLDFPDVTVAVASEANKGHALSLLCQDFGIHASEVLAVGDSVNDAPMLEWAGRGLAMAHGDHYAKEAADEVLAPEDGSLALVLEALALRGGTSG